MFERFSRLARNVVAAAQETAADRTDPRIGTEHLLIGVAEVGNPVMKSFDLSARRLQQLLNEMDANALGAVGVEVEAGALDHAGFRRGRRIGHIPFTEAAKGALERAVRIAVDHGHRRIGDDHILAALVVATGADPAIRLLRSAGVEPAELDAIIQEELGRKAS